MSDEFKARCPNCLSAGLVQYEPMKAILRNLRIEVGWIPYAHQLQCADRGKLVEPVELRELVPTTEWHERKCKELGL